MRSSHWLINRECLRLAGAFTRVTCLTSSDVTLVKFSKSDSASVLLLTPSSSPLPPLVVVTLLLPLVLKLLDVAFRENDDCVVDVVLRSGSFSSSGVSFIASGKSKVDFHLARVWLSSGKKRYKLAPTS